MAVTKKTPLEAEKADNETGSATEKRTRATAGGKKKARKDGAEQLRWAADRRLVRNSNKLAQVLVQKALHGDLASTKALLSMAEGKKPLAEEKGPLRSLALRLAAEPQVPRVREEGVAERGWDGAGREGPGNREQGTRDGDWGQSGSR